MRQLWSQLQVCLQAAVLPASTQSIPIIHRGVNLHFLSLLIQVLAYTRRDIMTAVIIIGAQRAICIGEVTITGITSIDHTSARCDIIGMNTMTGIDTTAGMVSVINRS